MPRPADPKPPLSGFYKLALGATFMAMLVIMIMNISTPFEFARDRLNELNDPNWLGIVAYRFSLLVLVTAIASVPFMLVMHIVLSPVRKLLASGYSDDGPDLLEKARQRIINLPFIMVPVNIGLWVLIPMIIFTAFFRVGFMDSSTAVAFSLRSTMVGVLSSAIIFFSLEAYARRALIPLLFPEGRLFEVKNTRRISIARRIRAFYRMGSLIPLAHVVLTLFVLFLQVDVNPMPTHEYARSVFIFSLVIFGLFFVGSGILTRLISRSIAAPVGDMLLAMKAVKQGDYETRVQVVSNDEIGILGDAFNRMIQGLEERKRLRDAFGRYVDPRIRDEILSGRIPLDGEYKDVTVMFADLREFAPLTHTHNPKTVVTMLNAYFKEMGAAIKIRRGLILQFLGDEIYAVFGAPVPDPKHPVHALRAALDMEVRLRDLNLSFKARGLPELSHGIGIHTGRVLAANIGSPDRLSYLLVGDTVNLASRLQAMTRDLDTRIIVSGDTVSRLPDTFSTATLEAVPEPVSVKGVDRPVSIFTVAGA
ncbi:MAG: HAMP domain-containing protein [Desulfobacterales bacterium]|nr:HAMP domain-containing protein [Desulfobacterales bacterium]